MRVVLVYLLSFWHNSVLKINVRWSQKLQKFTKIFYVGGSKSVKVIYIGTPRKAREKCLLR